MGEVVLTVDLCGEGFLIRCEGVSADHLDSIWDSNWAEGCKDEKAVGAELAAREGGGRGGRQAWGQDAFGRKGTIIGQAAILEEEVGFLESAA